MKIDKRTSTVESEWAIFKTGYSTIQNIFEPKLAILDPSFACTRVPLDQTRRLGVWVATILSCLPALIRYTRIKRVATDPRNGYSDGDHARPRTRRSCPRDSKPDRQEEGLASVRVDTEG